jgi:DNA-binding beta-propeller fold protein YncE
VFNRKRKAIRYVAGGPLRLPVRAYVFAALGLAGLAAIIAILVFRSQPKSPFDGFVYVESNTARRGANSVLAYRFSASRLRLLGEFRTGGTGTVDRGVTGSLDAEGQIAFDRTRRLLFAVNQGSDTIAVLRVRPDGTLDALPGSPFPSGGRAPASIGVAGGLLVVVDKAHDPARQLDEVRPAYATFRLGADGRPTPTGKAFRSDPLASPTQALPLPGGVVVATEESGPFRTFVMRDDGTLTQGPNSPLEPERSIFEPRYDGARWAIGLVGYPGRNLVYVNQAATEQLLVYTYDAAAKLTFVRAVRNRGSKLPCWTIVSPNGHYLYTANAGNGSVSAFDLKVPEAPRHLQTYHLRRGGNPWGLALDPSGRTLFVVDPRAVAGVPGIVGNRLHALAVGTDGRLNEIDGARVKLPVAKDASPLGIAVVPRS